MSYYAFYFPLLQLWGFPPHTLPPNRKAIINMYNLLLMIMICFHDCSCQVARTSW